jgi:hypothetical protein
MRITIETRRTVVDEVHYELPDLPRNFKWSLATRDYRPMVSILRSDLGSSNSREVASLNMSEDAEAPVVISNLRSGLGLVQIAQYLSDAKDALTEQGYFKS